MTIRKVVCVWGKFKDSGDFVLEPACPTKCNCEICKDAFWIEDVKMFRCKKCGTHYKNRKEAIKCSKGDLKS